MTKAGPTDDPVASAAWVALGANLGRRGLALARLRQLLDAPPLRIAAGSLELVTRAVGVTTQPDFLNQVLRLEAEAPLPASEWLARCKAAELEAGRRPTYRWGPRRADADLLLLGERGELRIGLAELTVPHPALAERPFLCALLASLDPELTHPDGWRFADRAGRIGQLLTDPTGAAAG